MKNITNPKYKYVFFGSPEFAAIVLAKLIAAQDPPLLVITNPDRPQGRKKEIIPPPAKIVAKENRIPVWQPETLSREELIKHTGDADLGLVAAYSQILKEDVLGTFPLGILGLHPSLLPKYRGASPIQSALMQGEEEAGVSLYVMDEKMDHGPVLGETKVEIEEIDDYFSLEKKLAGAGAELFLKLINEFTGGKLNPLPQDESQVTFTKKVSTQDAFIPPDEILKAKSDLALAVQIMNKIRALVKEPGAWTWGNAFPELQIPSDKRVKILLANKKEGAFRILKIQVEGKSPRGI